MCHLNEVGTYYIKLISSLINIKHLVLTEQVKLADHMAALSLFLSALDAELSARQTKPLPPPPVQTRLCFFVYRKVSNTSCHPPLSLLQQLDGIYYAELHLRKIVGG